MALQIRRGTDTQRQALTSGTTPAAGELLFSTDTKKLFIGDGTTSGGVTLGYFGAITATGNGNMPVMAKLNRETLNFIAGTNVSLVTDPDNNRLTINAAVSELDTGSVVISTNTISTYSGNTDLVLDPHGSGKVQVTGDLQVTGGTITGDLTGNVTGNVSGSAGTATTVTGATQSAITAVGTLLNLTVTNLINGSITGNAATASSIANGVYTIGDQTIGGVKTFSNGIEIFGTRFLNENADNLDIRTTGSGNLNIRAAIKANRIDLIYNPSNAGVTISSQNTTQPTLITTSAHNSASVTPTLSATGLGGSVTGAPFTLLRARGGLTALSVVQTGDEISAMEFGGHDGTSFKSVAKIKAVVNGTVSTGVVPGRIEFMTTNSSGASQVVLTAGRVTPGGWNVDASDNTVTLNIGDTVDFNNFSGSVLVNCWNSGTVSQYMCGGGGAPICIGSSKVTATGTMSSIGGGYRFTATETGTHTFYTVRTRTGA